MKRILTLTAAVAALAAAVLPAAPAAAAPATYEICVNTHTHYGVICNFDIGPMARDIAEDPVGFICADPAISCGPTRS